MLNTAIKAARRAGNIINRASLHLDKISISTKGPGDYVTDIDRHAEEAIIQILSEAYPDHAFVAEESGITGDSEYRWIIDPLDGTKNFIHGFPNYAVSIALAVRGQIEQAVIYDPNRNELFTASRGGGAFLNDRRIRVSPCPSLDVAIISVAAGPGIAEIMSEMGADIIIMGGSCITNLNTFPENIFFHKKYVNTINKNVFLFKKNILKFRRQF